MIYVPWPISRYLFWLLDILVLLSTEYFVRFSTSGLLRNPFFTFNGPSSVKYMVEFERRKEKEKERMKVFYKDFILRK